MFRTNDIPAGFSHPRRGDVGDSARFAACRSSAASFRSPDTAYDHRHWRDAHESLARGRTTPGRMAEDEPKESSENRFRLHGRIRVGRSRIARWTPRHNPLDVLG